jgi:hypothetical protein
MSSDAAVRAERANIITAMTGDGQLLPVIDVTNPAFAVPDNAVAVDVLRNRSLAEERRREPLPKVFTRLFLLFAARRSPLVRALVRPRSAFLDGLSTYALKLGPDNLVPPFDGPIDRRIAASAAVTSMRVRLQQVARLLAEGLAEDLAAAPGRSLHLINIGGGPAIDSLNALILFRRASPAAVARPITIHVLDPDTRGPAFGKNALAALAATGGPLAGLAVTLVHEPYSWSDTASLDRLVRKLAAEGAIIAASSEGALFEYASDEEVVANLKALAADGRGVRLVAGSVTRADDLAMRMLRDSPFKLVPRAPDRFAALAARGGFAVVRVAPAVLSDQVLLRPA